MSKPARINTDEKNGERLRKIQSDYEAKFSPASISLEAITNLAIELGENIVRQKLNLETKF